MPAQRVTIKIVVCALIGALFLIVAVNPLLAAMEFKLDGIENNLTEINYDQEINVLFSFNNVVPTKTYYLAGVFQQSAGSYYFGYTWNNNWYKYGDDYSNFYKLEIVDSSVSGKLKIKPDIDASGFNGTGEYQLKIYRFCSSKSPCGETNTATVKIIAPPSPSPSVSPSPSPTPAPSPSPSPSPSPTPIPSKSPSPKPSPSTEESSIPESATGTGAILGENEASTTAEVKKKNPFILSFVLIGLGGGFLAVTGVVFVKNSKYNKSL